MTTRVALTAAKPALVNDFTFCLPSRWEFADAAHGKSEIAFNPGDWAAISSIDSGALSVPSTIQDPVTAQLTANVVNVGFNVGLVAGQTYTFSLRGTGATPLPDSLLRLVADTNRNGVFGDQGDPDVEGDEDVVIFDDDGGDGLNSMITYTATYTGNHQFAVFAAGSGAGGQWTFQRITKDGADESDDPASAINLAVDGALYYGFIDSVPPAPAGNPYGPGFGEVDTFKVTLQAGKAYILEASGGADYLSNFNSLPPGEVDTVMVIYGPDGSIVTINDDASFANGDIGSAVALIAPADGVYTIDLFAYAPQTGGYSIGVREVDLDGLDPLDSLDWESANNLVPKSGTNVVKVYFAVPGESWDEKADNGTDPLPSFGWNAVEKAAVFAALAEYSKILGFTYEETTNSAEADFRLITTTSTQYGAYFYPQDPAFGDAQGIGAFNVNSGGWDKLGFSTQDIPGDQVSLAQGGFAFAVILHEFGHAHGLAHPHDTGGGSEVLAGVFGPFDSYGFYDLNQGVYTVMSYNDAWPLHPDGPSPFTIAGISNGWSGTLSAFDIAALQQRYGVSPAYATGNDVYLLRDTATPGTFYQTIYDTAGIDEIRYSGKVDVQIDLVAATLDYSATGGGVLSFVDGVKGGYTIANGVLIENASGGDGDDVLLGNDSANILRGNKGGDTIMGRGGDDRIEGGIFHDKLDGGDGNDTILGGQGNDTAAGGAGDDILRGEDDNDSLAGGDGADGLNGGNGNDRLNGGTGDDSLTGGDGKDIFAFDDGSGTDSILDFRRNQDKFDLSDIDANTNAAGDQGFAWIGAGAFTGVAGQLRSYQEGGFNYLAGDVDGDGVGDFLIQTNVLIMQSDIALF